MFFYQGDSGGPLVSFTTDVVKLVGIVSWGVDCAKPNAPGAYTNIFQYIDFIKTTVAPGDCQLQNMENTTYNSSVLNWPQSWK